MIMTLLSKNVLTKALIRMTSKTHDQANPFVKMTLPLPLDPDGDGIRVRQDTLFDLYVHGGEGIA